MIVMEKKKAFTLLQVFLGIGLGFFTRYLATRIVLAMLIMFLLIMDYAATKFYGGEHKKEWLANVFFPLALSFYASWVIFLNI